jgi:L-alanine-DL-glutamate epimerase-like enolase superfamily enzyme
MRVQLLPPRRVAAGTIMLRGTARVRHAVRIALRDEDGTCGWGEALPLPGYSRDDADIAFAVLNELVDVPCQVPQQASGTAQIGATLAPFESALLRSSSARFALECALLDLLSRRAGQNAAAWLAQGRALQAVAVSVLLPDDEAGAIATAGAAARRGHTVLKLKVARYDRSVAQERALLAAVRTAADAAAPAKSNCAWTPTARWTRPRCRSAWPSGQPLAWNWWRNQWPVMRC